MFTNISWHEYFTFLAVSTFIYYAVVYFLYFKNPARISLQQSQASFENSIEKEQPTLFNDVSSTEEGLQHIVYACMDELNAFFEDQKKTKAVKSELMFGLYTILQKYPALRNSDYKESLTNVIATQSENICSIHLSAEELKGVWFG